ncbi:2-keto-4-pentenoate hydratase [Salipiger thiooxidans]|uniref:2-keto-4-pentenoate hydratase n=1 Tax=Salipiger thiooxidans TaxID=282683 RepID=UPI001CD746E3|nr:fumarylacetoacetate hydrolase family protein [Salipiger thiooxidans]MCA0847567.1 hydratase [Salipiger thiooxidans]
MFRIILAALLAAGTASADCAGDDEISAYVDAYLSHTPARALGADGSLEDALCTQGKLIAALEPKMGPVVGYKVGLTSKPAQEHFGVSEPVMGVLYRDMLLDDGAEVPAGFGTVPLVEADLLLVVGDDGIREATTPDEVVAHLSALRPFIELPDLTFAEGEPVTGITLTAIGVAARLGVVGADIPVEDPAAISQALASMTVTLSAADGTTLTEAPGAAVLGHPANAVLWLMSKGVTLKAGDVVSVGSFGPLLPIAKAGGGATLTYAGLPGDPTVSVRFAD